MMLNSSEEAAAIVDAEFKGVLGMPVNQRNAHLQEELAMRVGVPHKGGQLTFHAFQGSFKVMVSASAFWNPASNSFKVPAATNLEEVDLALDSAGYTAMKLWQTKGRQKGLGGVFPWRLGQYIDLASQLRAGWWSQPDLCCEPQIASNQTEVDFRVNATATLLEATLRQLYEFQNELASKAHAWTPRSIANEFKPPVPVLQGWVASDYLRSLDLLMDIWQRWQPWLATPVLIGVGSVCRRSLKHPTHGLYAILAALEGRLPPGSRLHLFGVKGSCLSELKMLDWVASADSMAYDMGARMKALKAGHSNSMDHRSVEMTQWMQAAAERIRPSVGDQFRLGLFG
jgi:hypothetical protein